MLLNWRGREVEFVGPTNWKVAIVEDVTLIVDYDSAWRASMSQSDLSLTGPRRDTTQEALDVLASSIKAFGKERQRY